MSGQQDHFLSAYQGNAGQYAGTEIRQRKVDRIDTGRLPEMPFDLSFCAAVLCACCDRRYDSEHYGSYDGTAVFIIAADRVGGIVCVSRFADDTHRSDTVPKTYFTDTFAGGIFSAAFCLRSRDAGGDCCNAILEEQARWLGTEKNRRS